MIPHQPEITQIKTVTTGYHQGYQARALCQVDGLAAEVDLRVDLGQADQSNSSYEINVFNTAKLEWASVYRLEGHEVDRMPGYSGDPDVLRRLNELAMTLWGLANAIVISSRIGGDSHELAYESAKLSQSQAQRAQIEAARREIPVPARGWVAEGVTQDDFELHGAEETEPPFTGTEPEEQG